MKCQRNYGNKITRKSKAEKTRTVGLDSSSDCFEVLRQCRTQFLVIHSSENRQHEGCFSTRNESSTDLSSKPVIPGGITDGH